MPGFFFHGVKLAKATDDFRRQRVLGRQLGRLDKASTRVSHATGINNSFAQVGVRGVTITLEGAAKAFQEALRSGASAPHLKVEDDQPAGLAAAMVPPLNTTVGTNWLVGEALVIYLPGLLLYLALRGTGLAFLL